MNRFLGLAFLLAGMACTSFGGTSAVPEIDGTSGTAAIALVCGGILVLRSRKKK